MRANLEENEARGLRLHKSRYSVVQQTLTATYNIGARGGAKHNFLSSSTTRTVFLPNYTVDGGSEYLISNRGAGDLNVVDANGVGVTTVYSGETAIFHEGIGVWGVIKAGSVSQSSQTITAVSGSISVLSTDTIIVLNLTVAGAVTLLLPSAASRNGLPLEIYDWGGNAGDITLIPNGTDKIMGLSSATLGSNAQGLGAGAALRLIPKSGLGWVGG